MGVLRILLALSVGICHSVPIFDLSLCGGDLAVELFFLISGFYMALILTRKYDRAVDFFKARAIRLYPIYWITLAISLIFDFADLWLRGRPGPGLMMWMQHPPAGMAAFHMIFANLTFFGSFPINADYLFVHQSWTLGVEVLFYLTAPYLLRRMRLIFPSLAVSLILAHVSFGGMERFFGFFWPLFLSGALVYHLSQRGLGIKNPAMGVAGWGAIFFQPTSWIGCTTFFVIVALSLPALFDFTNRNLWDRRLGELSYPAYIMHWLVLFLVYQVHDRVPALLFSILCPVGILTAGWMVWRLDEWWQPSLRKFFLGDAFKEIRERERREPGLGSATF